MAETLDRCPRMDRDKVSRIFPLGLRSYFEVYRKGRGGRSHSRAASIKANDISAVVACFNYISIGSPATAACVYCYLHALEFASFFFCQRRDLYFTTDRPCIVTMITIIMTVAGRAAFCG